ncbi:hypothetical protein Mal4_08220 [Maioricimonas rarisocia]|uniref:Uncharacterized protein n=1 Tax=Maioricimonas rarisocia TaxID=2528026 RepID=A0A517Z238_9PLAN|nr:hypothetical protein Mal4_08220 [Maioricimonas rarisocia]
MTRITPGWTGKRPWTKGCHMTSKRTEAEFITERSYVIRHRDAGALLHEW